MVDSCNETISQTLLHHCSNRSFWLSHKILFQVVRYYLLDNISSSSWLNSIDWWVPLIICNIGCPMLCDFRHYRWLRDQKFWLVSFPLYLWRTTVGMADVGMATSVPPAHDHKRITWHLFPVNTPPFSAEVVDFSITAPTVYKSIGKISCQRVFLHLQMEMQGLFYPGPFSWMRAEH